MKAIGFLLTICIFGISSISSSTRAEDCPPKGEESIQYLKDLSKKLPTIMNLSAMNNIPEFCRVNGYRDSDETTSGGVVWIDNFVPTFETRENAFLDMFSRLKKKLANNIRDRDTYATIRDEIKSHREISQEEAAACNRGIASISGKSQVMAGMNRKGEASSAADDFKAGFAQAAFACKDLTLTHLSSCAEGLKIIQDIARPSQYITLIDTWKEVINDPVYFRVFRALALEMLDQIENNKPTSSHLFDDFRRLFLKEVKDPKLAEEYTWKSMGFWATSGSNLVYHASRVCDYKGDRSLLQLLHVISMGAPVLDRMSAKNGSLYSYPKDVAITCDYGKEYHFWMAAYLAREVTKRTKDVEGAAAAAFSADKGYQFMTTTPGRDRTRPFKENAFSNYNNNIRLDLTQAAAGAWFGATSLNGKTKPVSVQKYNDGLRKTFEGVQHLELNSSFKFPDSTSPFKLLGAYSDWKKIINSDAPFNYFKKEMSD